MYNYNYYSEDYLMHYGVKGMKWGVRRYQNSDGSLTAKGQKKLAKNEAYRDKLVKKAQRKADRNMSTVKEAEYNIKDLKERGRNSKAYKDYKESKDFWREHDYESKNKITDQNGNTYVKKYSQSWDRIGNDLIDYATSSTKVQDLIDENHATARRSREAAKQWTRNKKDLMNMNVDALTSKKDIRRAYRGR